MRVMYPQISMQLALAHSEKTLSEPNSVGAKVKLSHLVGSQSDIVFGASHLTRIILLLAYSFSFME